MFIDFVGHKTDFVGHRTDFVGHKTDFVGHKIDDITQVPITLAIIKPNIRQHLNLTNAHAVLGNLCYAYAVKNRGMRGTTALFPLTGDEIGSNQTYLQTAQS